MVAGARCNTIRVMAQSRVFVWTMLVVVFFGAIAPKLSSSQSRTSSRGTSARFWKRAVTQPLLPSP